MQYLIHDSECDMAKYFTNKLIHVYEHESENKREISNHATLTSVISGLFYARFLHCSSLYILKLVALCAKSGCKTH